MASGKPQSKQGGRSAQPTRPASKAGPAARSGRPVVDPAPVPNRLLGAGLVIGLYAMMPAFFTGGIHLQRKVEVVDHIVPGVLVLGLVVVAILRRAQPDTLMLVAGVGIVLAGFWMAATHIGLASQAFDNQASKAGALYHCSTAILVGALGVTWVWRYRAAGDDTKSARAV